MKKITAVMLVLFVLIACIIVSCDYNKKLDTIIDNTETTNDLLDSLANPDAPRWDYSKQKWSDKYPQIPTSTTSYIAFIDGSTGSLLELRGMDNMDTIFYADDLALSTMKDVTSCNVVINSQYGQDVEIVSALANIFHTGAASSVVYSGVSILNRTYASNYYCFANVEYLEIDGGDVTCSSNIIDHVCIRRYNTETDVSFNLNLVNAKIESINVEDYVEDSNIDSDYNVYISDFENSTIDYLYNYNDTATLWFFGNSSSTTIGHVDNYGSIVNLSAKTVGSIYNWYDSYLLLRTETTTVTNFGYLELKSTAKEVNNYTTTLDFNDENAKIEKLTLSIAEEDGPFVISNANHVTSVIFDDFDGELKLDVGITGQISTPVHIPELKKIDSGVESTMLQGEWLTRIKEADADSSIGYLNGKYYVVDAVNTLSFVTSDTDAKNGVFTSSGHNVYYTKNTTSTDTDLVAEDFTAFTNKLHEVGGSEIVYGGAPYTWNSEKAGWYNENSELIFVLKGDDKLKAGNFSMLLGGCPFAIYIINPS